MGCGWTYKRLNRRSQQRHVEFDKYQMVLQGYINLSCALSDSLFNEYLNTIPIKFLQLGVQGEHLGLFKPGNSEAVKWTVTAKPPKKQPLTWYKVLWSLSGQDPRF